MDILDYCDVCGEGHSTELCPELGLTSVQTEVDQLSTRARLTLPSFVEVVDNGSGLVGVVAKETIPIKTQMGPYEAKRTTHIFDDSGFFTLKLIAKDGTTVCLDTTDENECNWMCLVRAAASENTKNCIAYQLGNNIFYNTSREITPEEELLVWYAPHFARKLGKPSEPDGETRILLGHRIEPLTSDLMLDTEAHTVLQLTEELHKDNHDNQEQQSDEEGPQITVPSSQPSVDQRTGEIKKAFYCPRCGNTFDTQTEMVQHLREHILRADGKPRRGRGRPRKHLSNQRTYKIMNNRSAENGSYLLDYEHEELKVNRQSKTYERKRKLDSTEDMSDSNDDGDEDDDFVDVDATDKEYSPEKDIRVTGPRTQPRRSTRGKHTKLDDDYIYVFKKKGVNSTELSDYDKAVENNRLETEDDKKDKKVVKTVNKAVNTGSMVKKGRGRPKKVKQDEPAKNYVIIVQESGQTDSSRGNNNKVLSVEQVKESLTALKGKDNPDKLLSALKENNSETEQAVTDLGKLDETGINTEYLLTIVSENSLVIMENSQSEIDQAQNDSKTNGLVLSQNESEQIGLEEKEPGHALEGEFTDNVGSSEFLEKSEHLENCCNKNMTVDNKLDTEEKVGVTLNKEMNINEVVTESKDVSTDTVDEEVNCDNQSENPDNIEDLNNDINNELMSENINKYEEKVETTLNIDNISTSALKQNINELELNKAGASLTGKDSMLIMFEETKDGKYGCAVCDEKFGLEIEAISHFTNHTSETPMCKDCGREFKGLDSLLAHRKMCKQYACDICQQAFKTPQYLYRHMVIHTDVFRCEKCQKTFSRKDSMQKHILKCCPSLAEHYKIYYCEVCLRVFSKETGLKRHKEKCKSVQCQNCKKVFTSNADMTAHACKTSESEDCGKYSCGLCSKLFQSMYYLKRHQLTHESDHTCQKCKKTFTNKEDLESHKVLCKTLEMIRKYGSWKCEVCSQSFGNTKEFRSHFLEHSHPYQCEKCFKRFERMVALESHECEVTELLHCTVCLKTFKNQINLDKHTKEHSCMKFQCSACNEMFHSKAHAKDHNCIIEATADGEAQIISISDVKEVCPKCGKSFSSKSNLTKHMTLHGEKKFQCTYCSKHFHLEVYLREHITCVHYNIFKFQCNVCGRLLKSKTGLIAHNRIFHAKNADVFPCGKCGKVFKQKGNLRSHMFSHSTERKFRCDICPRAFKYPDQLSRHKFEHKLVPTFRCVHCEKDFIRPYDLKRHLQVYHSGYVYVCGVCSARCGHRHTLVRHYKRKHPESLHLTTQHGYLDSLLKHVNEVYESQNPDSKLSVLGENDTDGEREEQTAEVLSQVLSQEAAEALQSLALGHATAKQFQLLQDKGLFVHNLVNNVANELVDGLNQVIVPQDSYIFQGQGQSESQETENGVSMVTVSADAEETVGGTGLVQNADGTISINGMQGIPQTIEGLESGENQIVILQIIEPESQGQREMIHLNEEQAALIDLHQNREEEVIQLGEDQQGQVIQLTQENLLQEVLKQNVELSKHSQIQTVFVNRDGSYQTSLEGTDIESDQSLTIADSVINQNGDVAMDSDTVIPIQDGELDIQAPMVYSQDVTCTEDV